MNTKSLGEFAGVKCIHVHVPGLVSPNPLFLPEFGNDGPVWSAAELTQTKTKISLI